MVEVLTELEADGILRWQVIDELRESMTATRWWLRGMTNW
jgi:hypothetical protein